jgi:hypothetical protein
MDYEALFVELEAALATVPSLTGRVAVVGEKVTPPSAFIALPEGVDYDGTYQRGEDSTELQAIVVVGRTVARETRAAVLAYVAGSGTDSVKAALESYTYTECDVVDVPHADLDVATIAGVDYMAAIFTIKITGQGA